MKIQYAMQICLWGPTHSGLAGPDPSQFNFSYFGIPGLVRVFKVGLNNCYSGI